MPITQLCHFTRDGHTRLGALREDAVFDLETILGWRSINDVLRLPLRTLASALRGVSWLEHISYGLAGVTLQAPIGSQEVWAAGLTYSRSREARVEESSTPDVYQRAYESSRPELFMKATASRTAGPGQLINIRSDSTWDVPEPELVLVLNSSLEIAGFCGGNDVSSRSIEGENPLYLPQAKLYDGCFALGPAITLVWELPHARNLTIELRIHRDGAPLFEGTCSTRQMKRSFTDLVSHLGRANTFEHGVFLSTGTGIVPPDDVSLAAGDVVEVAIEQIGRLVNPVARLP
ncbi:MAG: fumarylacetoacetate hydrolase family protein [Chloroflexi bacterium]|nr:fumarylacetoacetate hydrolase family protein [Chloroflexota bacterium]